MGNIKKQQQLNNWRKSVIANLQYDVEKKKKTNYNKPVKKLKGEKNIYQWLLERIYFKTATVWFLSDCVWGEPQRVNKWRQQSRQNLAGASL